MLTIHPPTFPRNELNFEVFKNKSHRYISLPPVWPMHIIWLQRHPQPFIGYIEAHTCTLLQVYVQTRTTTVKHSFAIISPRGILFHVHIYGIQTSTELTSSAFSENTHTRRYLNSVWLLMRLHNEWRALYIPFFSLYSKARL